MNYNITYNHDRLRQNEFPVKEIELLGDITITKESTNKTFIDKYTITLTNLDETEETLQDVAFQLGMLVHSFMMLKQ